MADTNELKPCPFCGGEGHASERTCDKDSPYNPNDRAYPVVRCSKCFTTVGGKDWSSVSTAIEAWNKRALAVSEDCCRGAAPARFCKCSNTDERLRIATSLTHAVIDLNRGWNEHLSKREIAERLDLCRRFAIDMLAASKSGQ